MKAHPFHEFPKYMYLGKTPGNPLTEAEGKELVATGYPKSSAIANNATEEQLLRKAGYGDEYVHQDYPKQVINADGAQVTAATPEEETAIKALPASKKSEKEEAD